jgi:hypothetical protein
MKFSLTLGPRAPLDRQTAWGCFTTNQLGLPGLGSLAAGRRTGYGQMALSLGGLAITSVFGIGFMTWYLNHQDHLHEIQEQSGVYFQELWLHMRWAVLGMAVFLAGWLWALLSSIGILAESRGRKPLPPKIGG